MPRAVSPTNFGPSVTVRSMCLGFLDGSIRAVPLNCLSWLPSEKVMAKWSLVKVSSTFLPSSSATHLPCSLSRSFWASTPGAQPAISSIPTPQASSAFMVRTLSEANRHDQTTPQHQLRSPRADICDRLAAEHAFLTALRSSRTRPKPRADALAKYGNRLGKAR